MKRYSLAVVILVIFMLTASTLYAQDKTPTPTPRANTRAEATAEATDMADAEATAEATSQFESARDLMALFDELEQSRAEDGAFLLGDPEAPITIVEFSDYACPHCQNYRPIVEQIIEEYVTTGEANFEFRVFPTAGGQLTAYAAVVAECADTVQPGAFWDAYAIFYTLAEARKYDANLGQVLVDELGIDWDDILACGETLETPQVIVDYEIAQELGVGGTPAIVVRYGDGDLEFITLNGRTYNQGGPSYEVLTEVIEAAQEDA